MDRPAPPLALLLGMVVGLLTASGAPGAALAERVSVPRMHSVGCGRAEMPVGLFPLVATDGDRKPRTLLVQVPDAYVSTRAYPLVFVYHGAGGSSRESHAWGLQRAPGAAENAIFVFPDGIEFGHYGVGWDDSTGGRDLPFFDNLLDDLGARYCIELTQVFVAGFSWGGDFAVALACQRGDRIRAIALNSTDDDFKDNSRFMTYLDLPCATRRPPALRFEHAAGADAQYPAPDFATTSELLRYFNGCAAGARSVRSSTPVMACIAHQGCAADYVECSFETRLGHTLPPKWATDTWQFFAEFTDDSPLRPR